jgi:hypothetical protein
MTMMTMVMKYECTYVRTYVCMSYKYDIMTEMHLFQNLQGIVSSAVTEHFTEFAWNIVISSY